MPALTRRRYPERQDCWHIYFGDDRAGTIAMRAGNTPKRLLQQNLPLPDSCAATKSGRFWIT
jgi:hypothetical protein